MSKSVRKNLAVLIGGELREFDSAQKSWTFLNDDITYDIFFSTWDMSYQKYAVLNVDLVEEVNESRIRKYFPEAIISIETDNFLKNCASSKITYHWRKLFHMMDILNVEYENILLTRPDIYIDMYKDFKYFLDNKENDRIYGSKAEFKPPPKFGYVNDTLFIGDYNIIRKAFLTFTPVFENPNDIHNELFKHFLLNNIYIQSTEILNCLVIRPIHRGLLHLPFIELNNIENEWHKSRNFTSEEILIFLEELNKKRIEYE